MNFIAIDFETANEKRSSPCSIGITVIEDSQIKDEKYFLIRPKELRFSPMNIMIHGIHPTMVEKEKEFHELWPELLPYFENTLIVAHNASFDISVLRNTLDLYDIPYPNFRYCCTMVMSRHFYPFLENAKLNTVNNHLGHTFSHHHASADASACANILIEISKELDITTIDEIAAATGVQLGMVFDHGYLPAKSNGSSFSSSCRHQGMLSPSNTSLNIRSSMKEVQKFHLMNQIIALTGPLSSMTRGKAIDYIKTHGGTYCSSVSKKTTMLVTNSSSFHTLPLDMMSTKLRRAMELKKQGHQLAIVNENFFLYGN